MLRRYFAMASVVFMRHACASAPIVLALFVAGEAYAAQRTFVASYGLAANTAFNCSIVKPCRAFSEAISVTSAGGELIVLDSAGYGPVTITPSVSVIAPAGVHAGVSVFSGDGITVNAPGAIVVLRGLSINGQGGLRGILLQAAARVRIENCVVAGMSSAGISHNAPGAEMIVLDTVVRDNGGAGVNVNGDLPSAVLDRVRSEHNGGGGFYLAPTPGSVGVRATIVDSLFTHNGTNGIAAESIGGATVSIVVERSTMAYNGVDGFVATGPVGSSGVSTVSHSTLNDNGANGLSISAAGNVRSNILANVTHRNGDSGIRTNVVDPGPMLVSMSGNTAFSNLAWDLLLQCPLSSFGPEIYADNTNHFVKGVQDADCDVAGALLF